MDILITKSKFNHNIIMNSLQKSLINPKLHPFSLNYDYSNSMIKTKIKLKRILIMKLVKEIKLILSTKIKHENSK